MHALNWNTLKTLLDQFATVAIGLCNSGKEVTPQLFMVEATTDGRVAKLVALDPETMVTLSQDEPSKDALAALIRTVLTPGSDVRQRLEHDARVSPDVVVQITEAWTVNAAGADNVDLTIPPSQNPHRQECVLVVVHTPLGSIPTMHHIVNSPRRHCVRGEFPGPEILDSMGGRFSLQDQQGDAGVRH